MNYFALQKRKEGKTSKPKHKDMLYWVYVNVLSFLLQSLRMSKRSLFVRLVPCRCLRGEEEAVTSLDYSHSSLETVPKEIFSFEKTLQELYLDANQIEELPKVRCIQFSFS